MTFSLCVNELTLLQYLRKLIKALYRDLAKVLYKSFKKLWSVTACCHTRKFHFHNRCCENFQQRGNKLKLVLFRKFLPLLSSSNRKRNIINEVCQALGLIRDKSGAQSMAGVRNGLRLACQVRQTDNKQPKTNDDYKSKVLFR